MVDQSPRREIKVKITKPEPKGEPKPEYIYHWDRIISAAVALLLVLGLTGYGLHAWLRSPTPLAGPKLGDARELAPMGAGPTAQPGDEPQEATHPSSLPAQGAPVTEGVAVASDDDPAMPAEKPVMVSGAVRPPVQGEPIDEQVPLQVIAENEGVDPAPAGKAEDLPVRIDEAKASHPPPRDEISQPALSSQVDDRRAAAAQPLPPESDAEPQPFAEQAPPRETGPEPSSPDAAVAPLELRSEPAPDVAEDRTVEAAETTAAEDGQGRFRAASTAVASSAVKRFVLARSVEGNEPRGGLDDIVPDAKGVVEVSSFSEVIGLAGRVLEYRWLHEGEQVLRIRVPVAAERWRSHASKRIYPSMRGEWRVELRDANGNLLANAEFVYRP